LEHFYDDYDDDYDDYYDYEYILLGNMMIMMNDWWFGT